jgi:hypothetical protein
LTFTGGHLSNQSLCAARAAVSLFAALVCFSGTLKSDAAPPLLASPALSRQLQQRVTLTWDDQEVAAALERLAEVQRIPLWIDRRIDPHARVSLAGNNLTVAELMDRLAASEGRDWGWSTLRTVIYFGPRETARELATLSELARQAIAKAPSGMRRTWTTASPWEFPRLSEPRVLFDVVVTEAGAELREGTAIPHDLWPACSLPGVSPIDRAVLILAGFDLQLTASRDGRQVGVAPVDRPVQITATYPASAELQAVVDALTAADATIRARREGRRVSVSGRWEDQEQLRQTLNPVTTADRGGSVATSPQAKEQRYTLRIANKPVGAVLDQLAAQLQLAIVWDPALAAATPPARETLVSCEVREVDLDGLLQAVLTPAGLAFERTSTTVTIRAASSNSAPGSAGG